MGGCNAYLTCVAISSNQTPRDKEASRLSSLCAADLQAWAHLHFDLVLVAISPAKEFSLHEIAVVIVIIANDGPGEHTPIPPSS